MHVRIFGSLQLEGAYIGDLGFPGGSDGKASACNVGDLDSIPGLGRSPGGRHGNPLQYSVFLPGESPWTNVPGRLQSMGSQRVRHDWETKRAHTHTHTHTHTLRGRTVLESKDRAEALRKRNCRFNGYSVSTESPQKALTIIMETRP